MFIKYPELESIANKVIEHETYESIMNIVNSEAVYRLTANLKELNPKAFDSLSKGNERMLVTNIFSRLDFLFESEEPTDGDYISFYGLKDRKRQWQWIESKYIDEIDQLYAYKVFLPKANGSGELGEILSTPIIAGPKQGHTQTFISIGSFESEYEAESCMKYIKTKFARALLGVLKVTQDNKKSTWEYVPLQDFTPNSDIDWSKSISEIDQQLYAKYGLSQDEIDFIEENVEEMD